MALPPWWEDTLAENPAGYAQCLVILSRHLGLEYKSLQDPDSQPRLKDFGVCKYKKRQDTTDDELLLSRVIATRAAQLAAAAMERPYFPLPASANDIRQVILESAPWVGFEQLLDFCWQSGIPVLHVNFFPRGAKRPEGSTLRVGTRPVIVLCKNIRQPAWLLFILAHELGHIGCGHIPENGALIDEKMHDNVRDQEEEEADRFALELLTGNPDARVATSGRWPNAKELVERALAIGKRNRIDPGHIILNYAYSMGGTFFPVANRALGILEPAADAIGSVRDKIADQLDWERLPEDSSDFLMRMTRQEADE